MRVWFVHHYAYTPEQSAGTRHHALARQLIAHGHEVLVVSCSFYHKAQRERLDPGETWRKESVDGVPFLWLRAPAYSGNSPKRVLNMVAFALRVWRRTGLAHEPRPDVVLGSSPDLFAALGAERVARRLGVPFLLEVRDLWPGILIDMSRMGPHHPLMWTMARIERYLYRHADAILAVMKGAPDHMVPLGADPARIRWLPNAVTLEDVRHSPPPDDGGPFTMMYAGVHGHYNNLDVVLEAAALLEQRGLREAIRIRLVGEGNLKPKLERQAREMGLHIVSFEPAVPKKEVYRTLAEAHAYLMVLKPAPIFRFGVSPNKLFDYMAMARPVLYAIDTPHNPIEEASAGVSVRPGDPESIADGIETLLRTPPAEREAMGKRARAHVETYHSIERLSRTLESTLAELLPR